MWLFTRYGFFSIASARTPDGLVDPHTVMIRARTAVHLKSLKQRFASLADAEVLTWPDRDYHYRLIVAKHVWTEIVTELAEEQEWSNFKNETARYQGKSGTDYVHALHQIWTVMHSLQERVKPLR